MSPERFAELIETYGAEPRRWPEAQRNAATTWMDAHPEVAANALRAARRPLKPRRRFVPQHIV